MPEHPTGFFEGTEMPTAGWWEALWPDPAGVLAAVGLLPDMDVIDHLRSRALYPLVSSFFLQACLRAFRQSRGSCRLDCRKVSCLDGQ